MYCWTQIYLCVMTKVVSLNDTLLLPCFDLKVQFRVYMNFVAEVQEKITLFLNHRKDRRKLIKTNEWDLFYSSKRGMHVDRKMNSSHLASEKGKDESEKKSQSLSLLMADRIFKETMMFFQHHTKEIHFCLSAFRLYLFYIHKTLEKW